MCFRNHLLTSATTTPISLLLLICFIIATKTICLHAAEPSKDDFAHKWTRRYSNPHSSHQEQLWPADNGQSSSTSLSVNHRTIRATTTINICDSVCNCTKENEIFVGIECSFATDNKYILGSREYIPENARTLRINLAPHAQLQMRENLFKNNKLNRVSIDGNQLYKQQVDLDSFAFHNNKGLFPEIEVKNVHSLHIRGNAFNGEFKLNVVNCVNVIVAANAFNDTAFHGFFEKISDLRFETNAFHGNRDSKIEIVGSNVGLLEKMDASMKEVKIVNSRIEAIKSNTFNVLSINSIEFINCDIGVIEPNATTEKLHSNYLGLLGCRIATIQSDAISNSGIAKVVIENNNIDSIEANGIGVSAINVSVTHNSITKAAHRWINIKQWSNINIYNNSFGHFDLIGIEKNANPVQCVFQRNSITKPEPNSLNLGNKQCSVKETLFFKLCTCNLDWITQISTREDLKSTSYCQIDSALKHCFNSTTLNVQNYIRAVCSDKDKIDCQKSMADKKIDGKFIDPFLAKKTIFEQKLFYIIGFSGVLLFVIIAVTAIVLRYRCLRSKNNAVPPRSNAEIAGSLNTNKDSKSFTNDDRLIIKQALDKLRTKQSEDVYNHVFNNTTRLLSENLSETEKVLTIGEIVRVLDECDNIGEDFVAFTDILYRHLDDNQQPDPVYAEPITTAATIVNQPQNMQQNNQTTLDADHIYAEPNSAQQPLLTNEYSLPVDRNEQTNLYSEPVLAEKDIQPQPLPRKWITPYAIGLQLPPVPSPNLPDVLAQSSSSSASAHQQMLCPIISSMPMYSIPHKNTFNPGIGTSAAAGSSSSTPFSAPKPNSSACSSHSGGSDITMKIDEIG